MTSKEQIINRLKDFARQDFNNELLFSILSSLGIIILLLTVIIIFFISPFFLLLALPPIVFLVRNLMIRRQLKQIAQRLENGFPQIKDYLVNAVELTHYPKDAKEGYSFELINAAIDDAALKLAPIPINKLINRRKTSKSLIAFISLTVIFSLYTIIFSNRAKLGFYAAFAPNKTPIAFVVTPGNLRVDKESKVTLNLTINSPYHFNQAVLSKRTSDGKIVKKRVRLNNQTGAVDIVADQDFDYSFKVFSRKSQTYHIGLLKLLAITSLSFKYIFPNYTRLTPVTSQAREISVLPGTRIEFSGTAENRLDSGKLWFNDSTVIPLTLADNKFSGSFTAKQDASFEIRLKDISGNHNEQEIFKLNLMPDESPFVKIFQPGHDIDLPVTMKVLLGINSIDDYGLSNLSLYYVKDSVKTKINLKNIGSRLEDTTYYYWDLSNIGFMPGDAIQYYVTVTDNDAVLGPKQSSTEIYTIRFPTVTEIYSQTTNQTTETEEQLEPIANQQEQLGQEMDRIDQELKKERKLGWEEKTSLGNMVSNQKKLLDQIEDLKQEVKNTLENMFEGLMLDKESIDKLQELQKLLSDLLPQELKEALQNLAQALEKQSPDMKNAMERFQISQDALKKALDRAVELLKNIQEEEKLKALAKKADALYQAQKDLNSKFNEDLQKLAPDENKIKEGLESLEKETDTLSKEMSDKELAQDLAKLMQELAEMQASAQAGEISKSMQQGQKSSAQNQSQKLLKDLASLKKQLEDLVQKMSENRSREITEKLLNSARDLVALSQEQERLENQVNKNQNLPEIAGEQKRLEEASRAIAESLAALAQKSIKIPPNLGEDIIRSLNNMENAANNLQDNNIYNGKKNMADARAGLDAATGKILNTIAQAQQSGGFGGGMENLLQQLSQMTAEQMMLNQEMGGMPLPIPMPGGLSPQQLAQIERMLSKQRGIRQTLEEMRQSMGTEPGLTSNLDAILEEMKQVERDLSQLVVNRELIQRQEKILSRLLDVQRSVRQREFKEKRESEVGKAFEVPPTPTLPTDLGERKKILREKLLQALKENYPKDYERLIKLYFESLLQE
jgi:hypothetical protein